MERWFEHQLTPTTITEPDVHACPGMLLDEWDTQIAEYTEQVRAAADACRELVAAGEAMAIIRAHTLLSVRGRSETERDARLMLTLRRHAGWRGYRQQAWRAQDRIREARRRAGVARMRCELNRTALTVTLGREGDRGEHTGSGVGLRAQHAAILHLP